jgi:hypothetical protein
MIPQDLDAARPEELAAAVYQYLARSTADFGTYERLKDRRVIPALVAILDAGGTPPPLAAEAISPEQILTGAARLLSDVADAGDREAVRALIAALDRENDRVKIAAARALGQMGAVEAGGRVTALTARLLEQGDLGGLSKLVPVLGQIGGAEAKPLLEGFIAANRDSPDKHARYVADLAREALAAILAIRERAPEPEGEPPGEV